MVISDKEMGAPKGNGKDQICSEERFLPFAGLLEAIFIAWLVGWSASFVV